MNYLLLKRYTCSLLMLFVLLSGNDTFSRDDQQKVTRQSSLDAFNRGNYELAYQRFNELLITFPRDPLYKYYSGICLVKMQKDPEKAVTFLSEARRDGAVVRTVPSDALFWLGRAQQMSGLFGEAVASFNEFTDTSGKKAARELGVPEYIQQCMNRKGQIAEPKFADVIKDAEQLPQVVPEMVKILPVDTLKTEKAASMKEPPAISSKAPQPVKTDLNPDTKPESTTSGDTTFKSVLDEHVAEAVKQPAAAGMLMLFKIDPELIYDPAQKIQINPKHPQGLIYRIQVAVFRNPVALSHFKGITPVYGFKNQSTGLTTYYAGLFRKLSDAKKALLQVRQKGFKDAFVVAFSGGKAVSSERAALLEKEWGIIPFTADVKNLRDSQADTIPPTLSFRVEVVRTIKPVSEQSYEGMKKLSGTRGLDIETLADGKIVYLIGKFITYDSAEDYAGLLIRNGYRDAKVVAWLGKKEIPVETARKLIENLE